VPGVLQFLEGLGIHGCKVQVNTGQAQISFFGRD